MKNLNYAIVTGTGRCGTQFLSKLLALSPNVSSRHDPNPLNLTFHRYSKWYNLPIDNEAFFLAKEKEIVSDLKNGNISVHSSAHMAFSVEDLYQRFNCKIIVLYRHPANVVNSYLGKGLYIEDYILSDTTKAIGFQNVGTTPHHFFSRTVPKDSFFLKWKGLSRVGKIAWMWSIVNSEIMRQISKIPQEKLFVSKIEDFDYKKYKDLTKFLNVVPTDENTFNQLSGSKPNKLRTSDMIGVKNWTETERQDFFEQVREVSLGLDYPLILDQLIEKENLIARKKSKKRNRFHIIKKLIQLFR